MSQLRYETVGEPTEMRGRTQAACRCLLASLLVAIALVAVACSNPSLESIVGMDDDSTDAGEPAEAVLADTVEEVDSATSTDGDDDQPSTSPLGIETDDDSVRPAPTAVFAPEDETTAPPPAVTGAYLVARTGAGRQVPGSGTPAFILPVYDEPEGTVRSLVYTRPDGSTLPYPLVNPSYFGNTLVLRVVSGEEGDEWIQVQAPVRPADTWVWVQGSDFDWVDGDERIEVDMSDSTMRVYRGDERLLSSRVATGAVDTPTPLGVSYVSEIIGARSPILNLALFANTNSAAGQPLPAITLVGTADSSELGERITRGTLRAPNDTLATLADEVSPGALVIIFDSSEEATDRDAIVARDVTPAATTAP